MVYNERGTWVIREKESGKVVGEYRTYAYAFVEFRKMKDDKLEIVKVKKIKNKYEKADKEKNN